jgi:membrane fusion protein, type I secretion system
MRASVPHLKVVERRPAPARTDTSPRAVAELLARAARQKHREADLRPDNSVRGPFSLPQTHRGAFSDAAGSAQTKRIPSREKPKTTSRRQATEQTVDFRAWSRERWLQLRTALRESAEAASPVVKNGLARLDSLLWPEPVLAPTANADAESLDHHFEHALSSELRRGGRVLTIAGVIALGWAVLVPLSGAVIVAGQLVLHSNVKKVQHPTGGVIAEILVRNGSKVDAGEKLARLEETTARTNLQVVARQLDEVRLRIARLNAERSGAAEPRWPSALAADIDPLERDRLLESERDFFAARATTRRSEQNLAQSRIDQLEKQIAGLEAQLQSNRQQMGINADELKSVENLLQDKLVTIQRATTLQRDAVRMEGLDGQIASQIAETNNKVHETKLQALQIEQTFRSEVIRELSEAEAKEGELTERKLAAEDQLNHTIIRAPTSGIVHELAVHTTGGVITPAEVLMLVVPNGDALEVDAHIPPDKIDQVRTGQSARIRLSAFNSGATPELNGVVDVVSPDLVHDQSGAYYDVRISLKPEEIQRLGDLKLTPGMPAEVFLKTKSRTMLSYLFKPITDQLSRMFRER